MPKAIKSKIKKEGKSPKTPPRVVIKFNDSLDLPYDNDEAISKYLQEHDIIPIKELFQKFPGMKIKRLLTSVEPSGIIKLVNKAKELNPKYQPPNFLTYCAIDYPHETKVNEMLEILRKYKNVEFAYLECEPCVSPCNFVDVNPGNVNQGYLDPAPTGINARFAWGKNGGCGEGQVQFIDIEYAWILNHEDIRGANVNFLWGDRNEMFDNDHGTSVLGIILMQDNPVGGLGITPMVRAQVASRTLPNGTDSIADALIQATASLNFGDIVLLELQVSDTNPPNIFWPVEIEETIFRLIELATNNGIIVIEAAGNGNLSKGFNLDDFSDENGRRILDPTIPNPRDSGAIIVAAAASSVKNGKHGKRRSSNYGKRVDCYAWGSNVYTSDDPNKHQNVPPYINNFDGTSSASAIIAGAAISFQSIVEAARKSRLGPLGPLGMRTILSNPANGTSSRNAIGVMPDLKAIINNVLPGLP